MRKFINRNQIKAIVKTGSYGMTKKLDEAKTLSSRSIKAIVEGVNSDGETFFRINNVDSDGYRIMLALTISLITSEDTPPEKNKRLYEELNRELIKVENKNIRKSLTTGKFSHLLSQKTIDALEI